MFSRIVINKYRPRENVYNHACAGPARSQYFLAQRSCQREDSEPVCFPLWAVSDAGTTLRFADVWLGLKPSKGNTRSPAGVERGAGRLLSSNVQQ